ncbi:M1 family metallopeptidase [Eudoraea chungangensis]|uniref:M1 family metallopeptidase n=1 Tax=Eudoraea chungangensis TaxID=1481905 RepID=UPI0023EE0A7E|nr:M1 family metallopeptidase [Eudoraea chungangensis]
MRPLIYLFISFFSCVIFCQKQSNIDFVQADISITIDTLSYKINGSVKYRLLVKQDSDSLFLNAVDMKYTSLLLNGKKIPFKEEHNKLIIWNKFKKNKKYSIAIEYEVIPKNAVYFIGWEGTKAKNQIWTQGQGKENSHWVPSIDDMSDKVLFNLEVTFNSDYEVIASGKLLKTKTKNGRKRWKFSMLSPMSSYLLAFVIGNYNKSELSSKSGIPIILYSYPEDSLKIEPTYRYSEEIFNFMVKEIGVPFPWKVYKQVPVRDFLYAGMENTTATIFADTYVIDSISFLDRNYVNVNAHELAHQWFGNMVTEKDASHHWLHEGFATYYALLAEKHLFGEDYFYWKLYDTALQLHNLSLEAKGEALTNPLASSITFYEKGAWALFILSNKLGEEVFKLGMQTYLHRYGYQTVTVTNFLEILEEVSNTSLRDFKEEWLVGTVFPYDQAIKLLRDQSEDINDYLDLERLLITESEKNQEVIQPWWKSASETQKERVLLKYRKSIDIPFLINVFEENNLLVRRALSVSKDRVPQELRTYFESLLNDKSYVTQENALYRLWISFPEYRKSYLDKTKETYGLPNYSLRLLWLSLALITKDYASDADLQNFASELFGYTSPQYAYEIRQNAFGMIISLFPLRDNNLIDLMEAADHHFWRFRNYARKLLNDLLADENEKERILEILKDTNNSNLRYIKTKVKTK